MVARCECRQPLMDRVFGVGWRCGVWTRGGEFLCAGCGRSMRVKRTRKGWVRDERVAESDGSGVQLGDE
jgi:hypothetical protein